MTILLPLLAFLRTPFGGWMAAAIVFCLALLLGYWWAFSEGEKAAMAVAAATAAKMLQKANEARQNVSHRPEDIHRDPNNDDRR